MNTILILVAGIVMSTIIGTQVAPSIVEGVKVKKHKYKQLIIKKLSLKQLKDTQQ